jgi:hypothetical protein
MMLSEIMAAALLFHTQKPLNDATSYRNSALRILTVYYYVASALQAAQYKLYKL